jgi:threonine dehydrogenase-like Zn-dependent dehydrogenase
MAMSTHARVAAVTAPGTLAVDTRAVEPKAGEVLVRVRECGICGSDIKLFSGTHPTIQPPLLPGHEFHGTVEAVGPGTDGPEPGTDVVIFPPIGCGRCRPCERGRPHLCAQMSFVGGEHPGGLAELVAVPAGNALPMDAAVPEGLRVLTEPLAVGVHAASRAGAEPGDEALVIGAGPIGLFTALALRARGVERILLADVAEDRLALARRLGVGETVNSAEVPLAEHVREQLRPEGADLAFDCVGRQATAADALAATGKGGRTVLVGIMPRELTVDGVALQRGERAMIGVQQSTREDFAAAMAILAGGALTPSAELIRRYPLADAADAFAALQEGRTDVLKRVVRP